MSKKRATLPTADILFGSPRTKEKSKAVKPEIQQSVLADTQQNTKATLYFSPQILKEIEKTRVRLLTDYDLKITKSRLVEAALRVGLENTEKLIKMLK